MNNPTYKRLVRELMGKGFTISVFDGEEDIPCPRTPAGFRQAIDAIESVDGATFDAHMQGRRVGTVFTAIGFGNLPDETVADWAIADTPWGDEFREICERIVC